MASLVLNDSGTYSIRFRLGKYRFNRSLETTDEKEAKDEKNKIERTIRLHKQGDKQPPEDATPGPDLDLPPFRRKGPRWPSGRRDDDAENAL